MIEQIHLEECQSTQDILKEQLKDGATAQHILVSCENQIQGRGRGDKFWTAMSGTVCFSLGLEANPELSFTAIEISVLVAKFFEAKGKTLKLKWPNDLWNSEDKKCCGILVQAMGPSMLVGIGLNLYSESRDYGGVYSETFALEKKAWALELSQFILRHRYLEKAALVADWEQRCLHLHKRVRLTEGAATSEGIFKGLGVHGEALLLEPQGTTHHYNGSLFPL